MEQDTSRKPRPGRPHTIPFPPPALGWSHEVSVLEDLGSDLALTFWRILRRVRMWAEAEPEEHDSFSPLDQTEAVQRLQLACAFAPELADTFGTFAVLVRTPRQVQPRKLAEACRLVCDWAQGKSLPQVAMLFAEAAATVDPSHPTWANDAGQLCRVMGLSERSLEWFHRGFGLAVQSKSRYEVIYALHREGLVMSDLGRDDEARSLLNKALRRALGDRARARAAAIHHDLMLIATRTDTYSDVGAHLLPALDYYPSYDPRIPVLVHDWAVSLSEQGTTGVAISLLSQLLPLFSPEKQSVVYGNLAISLARAGLRERFEEAVGRAFQQVGTDRSWLPIALSSTAEAAGMFGKWDQAAELARRGLEAARENRNIWYERHTLTLLDRIARHDLSLVPVQTPDVDRIEMTERRVVARLQRWKARGGARLEL